MMNSEKMKADYERTREVILSCKNMDQLKVGVKMFNQLNRIHNIPEKDMDKLANLIGLMRIKCGVEGITEEMSKIEQEFHKEAQKSGVQDLKNIAFNEDEIKGGLSDDMTPESLAKKHKVSVKDIEKEINVGTKIEMEHTDSKKKAKEIAMDHIYEFSNYYTDSEYGIIAIEDKLGDKRKTVRISKSEMEKLHKTGKITVNGINISYKEDLKEDLDSNDISSMLRNQLKQRSNKRFTKDEIFDEIRRRKEYEHEMRKKQISDYEKMLDDEFTEIDGGDIDEATDATSSGSYISSSGFEPMRRTFKKSDIPVSVGGLNKPIGKLHSTNKRVLDEEEDLDEATTTASVGGQYVTPKFWAKGKDNWRNRVKKTYPNGKFVNIKKKCKNYPYCDQGSGGPSGSPITLTNTSEMEVDGFFNESKVIKTIKKSKLRINR
jgi:hypothetical protein